MANSVDPDQTPRFAASVLGLPVCKGLSVPIFRVITVLLFARNLAFKVDAALNYNYVFHPRSDLLLKRLIKTHTYTVYNRKFCDEYHRTCMTSEDSD